VPQALEDSTVALLRRHGVLRAPRPRWLQPSLLAAAAVALFALGLGIGMRVGAPPVAQLLDDPVIRLQLAGSNYVTALSRIADSTHLDGPVAAEVALTTYHGVARELLRIVTPEVLASQTMAAFNGSGASASATSIPTTIWF
jgi:hypothetical protein